MHEEFCHGDYVLAPFTCETCGYQLWQTWPSNMLSCHNTDCDNREPLFWVESS